MLVLLVLFFLNLSWMGAYCVYLWVLQTIQISRNITTNESINWRHYPYLYDEVSVWRGCDLQYHHFRNPYDHGFVRNWLEFWGLSGDTGYGVVSVVDV